MTRTSKAIAVTTGLLLAGLQTATATEPPQHWTFTTQAVRSDVEQFDVRGAEGETPAIQYRVGCTAELIGAAPQCPLNLDGSTAGARHFASL